jgi:uncharacterized membrane protein YagU involved in acid resistance
MVSVGPESCFCSGAALEDSMQAELASATAGFAATVPMTAFMEVAHKALPEHEQYPLPPRRIVDNALNKADAEHHDEQDRLGMAIAAHFAFGTLAGSAYGPIARTRPSHPVLAGVGFGLMVWVSQYLGTLPALGLHEPATEHPVRRNALMIAAHVIWGGTLGYLAAKMTDDGHNSPWERRIED